MVALRPGVAEAGSESGRGTGVPHAGGASVWAEHAEGARVQARELDSPAGLAVRGERVTPRGTGVYCDFAPHAA
jgi:hypothetical protein